MSPPSVLWTGAGILVTHKMSQLFTRNTHVSTLCALDRGRNTCHTQDVTTLYPEHPCLHPLCFGQGQEYLSHTRCHNSLPGKPMSPPSVLWTGAGILVTHKMSQLFTRKTHVS